LYKKATTNLKEMGKGRGQKVTIYLKKGEIQYGL
jgi:hypothetical protein